MMRVIHLFSPLEGPVYVTLKVDTQQFLLLLDALQDALSLNKEVSPRENQILAGLFNELAQSGYQQWHEEIERRQRRSDHKHK